MKKISALIFCFFYSCLIPNNLLAGEFLNLYQKALENNPTLLSRQYTVEQSIAREDQAFSGLLPQVSMNGSYSYNRYHPLGDDTVYYDGLRGTIQARQVLFDLSTYLRYQGAEASTRQSKEELEAYRMQLAGDLVDRYLLVLEGDDRISYLKEEKKSVHSQINRLKKMFKLQMVRVTDLYEVEAYDQALNTQIIEAENEMAIAKERIREITSFIPEAFAKLTIKQFPEVPVNIEQWVEDAIKTNPNITALNAAIEAADKNISGSKAEHLPELALQLSHTYSDQGFDNRQSTPYNVSSANLQLNVPLYSGGSVNAEIREEIAGRNLLVQEQERIRRQIELETRTAFLNSVAGNARIDSTYLQLKAQEKATSGQQKGYDLGASTIVDVLESRRDLMLTRTEYWQSHYEYLRNLVALKVWSGGLSPVNMEEIDHWFSLEN